MPNDRFNPRLAELEPYPFQRLQKLLQEVQPAAGLQPLSLAVGEPQAPPEQLALDALHRHQDEFNVYPPMAGIAELRQAGADWLCRRFGLDAAHLDPDRHVLPVSGSREGLFSLIQVLAVPGRSLVFANPFYQLYAGAAVLGGMRAAFLADATGRALRQAPESLWRDCAALVLCSPHNPTGEVLSGDDLQLALELSDRFGFAVIADECYCDLYLDEQNPPVGLLQACRAAGRTDWRNCIVFESLSKRSSLAGMRSGLAAGDADIMARYLDYRNYHGVSVPVPVQRASAVCWQDDAHVARQRAEYRQRFDAFDRAAGPQFQCPRPAGGFYYWMPVPPAWNNDDEAFTRDLWAGSALRVVPGSYLAGGDDSTNPGVGRVRMALVASPEECTEAGERLRAAMAAGPLAKAV